LSLLFPENIRITGDYLRIPIFAGEDFEMQGIQICIGFDHEFLKLTNIDAAEVLDGFFDANMNLAMSDKGVAIIVWAAPDGASRKISAGQKLFELIMKAPKNRSEWIQIKDKIKLNHELMESILVCDNLTEFDIRFESGHPEAVKENSFRFAPNPFNKTTTLYLDLAEAKEVSLQLLDIDGRLLYKESKWFESGNQTWNLSDSNFSNSKVIIFQIQTDSEVFSGRLMKTN
jgi:hypothetical protein